MFFSPKQNYIRKCSKHIILNIFDNGKLSIFLKGLDSEKYLNSLGVNLRNKVDNSR